MHEVVFELMARINAKKEQKETKYAANCAASAGSKHNHLGNGKSRHEPAELPGIFLRHDKQVLS
jgi:hypothetical protein